nr:MAG TPA: hypothetical protein [Caudoviricetes sp.]
MILRSNSDLVSISCTFMSVPFLLFCAFCELSKSVRFAIIRIPSLQHQ